MVQQVFLNDVSISITDFHEEEVNDKAAGKKLRKISFNFKVTSEEYHDITTLLYQMNFHVKVPEKEIEFPATIHSYSTSITNLYKENQVGDFQLELIERL
ncbi:DUF3219 family protein [Sporosarcina sp. Marseille-Q4063]|uniref:DUF3219 family protein n=1 Tax=Sporosarcina sp. Marseille-Q4063 TaxID=2810514 RepID=UPI001BAF2EDC|nr:DUF3219 family protein [Sporosarcina sp. Marseille-Q4063]QUW21990.1 DUF3219 family protein [Sporosarcina sp. Marseille-Q4063]